MGDIVIEHNIEPILGFFRAQTKLNFVILMDNASAVGWPWLVAKHPHCHSHTLHPEGQAG